jgi:UV damage repair endonuclease
LWIKRPYHIRSRITLENDDKSYTVKDVLGICEKLGSPMVLDIHHHLCNNENENISHYLPAIFDTWNNQNLPPKIHISSPRDSSNLRSHADNVDPAIVVGFLQQAKSCGRDLDVMIEAKHKDLALFNLMQALTDTQGIRVIDKASIEI